MRSRLFVLYSSGGTQWVPPLPRNKKLRTSKIRMHHVPCIFSFLTALLPHTRYLFENRVEWYLLVCTCPCATPFKPLDNLVYK